VSLYLLRRKGSEKRARKREEVEEQERVGEEQESQGE
jgi:hypothetical protein